MIAILKNMMLNFLGVGSRIDTLEKFLTIKDQEIRQLKHLASKQAEILSNIVTFQVYINNIISHYEDPYITRYEDDELENMYENFIYQIPDDDDLLN